MIKKIDYIVVHCSATEEGRPFNLFDINAWHKQRGWQCVGYHYVIPINGTLERGRPLKTEGAHCLGFNDRSLGICYIGGLRSGKPADTRTLAQQGRMEILVKELLQKYPKARVCGHRDLTHDRDCPCFDVAAWACSVGIPKRNIYSDDDC